MTSFRTYNLYFPTERWGDMFMPCESLEELTELIRNVCEINGTYWDEESQEDRREFEFPAEGLREGIDYTVETCTERMIDGYAADEPEYDAIRLEERYGA